MLMRARRQLFRLKPNLSQTRHDEIINENENAIFKIEDRRFELGNDFYSLHQDVKRETEFKDEKFDPRVYDMLYDDEFMLDIS